jgi:N-acetylneuraminate synthase
MIIERIQIGERNVGLQEPCFIIAEAGSNHNGNFDQALRLIDVAREAGAEAVKFQNFKAERLYPKTAGQSDYLKLDRPIFEIIRDMEMPPDWIPHLARYCREKQIDFISSPFDEESADLLDPHVEVFKVASYEITHAPLLRHIARKGKPLIVSTGASTLEEVKSAVEIIRGEGNDHILLLQCTASYPTPMEDVNVRALVTLREHIGLPTGISDHSRDPVVVPIAAVSVGACVIEKHFTLSNLLPGPDHVFAVEPRELKEMVRCIRDAEKALGHGRKEALAVETELRRFARRSIFAVRDISPGDLLSRENVAVLRAGKAGFGLSPEHFEELLGRKAKKFIPKEFPVNSEDLE